MASERKPLFFFDGRLLGMAKTPEQEELLKRLIAQSVAVAVVRRCVETGWYKSKEQGEKELRQAEANLEALIKQVEAAFKEDGGQ